jgi:drug/metabolite transporter (DMT)-like permease
MSHNMLKYLLAALVIAIGVAAVVAGEADDSPGLQLLGVLLVVAAVALGVRVARRSS